MPVWFKPLVNKVLKEGEDVSGKLSTMDRVNLFMQQNFQVLKQKLFVTQDLNTGNVAG